MGIHLLTDRMLHEREQLKDARIEYSEARVTRLTEQNKMLSEEKARLEETWKINYDDLQARYDKASARITELVAALREPSRELEAERKRYRELAAQVERLQEQNTKLATELGKLEHANDALLVMSTELLALVRIVAASKTIRSDRPSGKIIELAQSLVEKYDEPIIKE